MRSRRYARDTPGDGRQPSARGARFVVRTATREERDGVREREAPRRRRARRPPVAPCRRRRREPMGVGRRPRDDGGGRRGGRPDLGEVEGRAPLPPGGPGPPAQPAAGSPARLEEGPQRHAQVTRARRARQPHGLRRAARARRVLADAARPLADRAALRALRVDGRARRRRTCGSRGVRPLQRPVDRRSTGPRPSLLASAPVSRFGKRERPTLGPAAPSFARFVPSRRRGLAASSG